MSCLGFTITGVMRLKCCTKYCRKPVSVTDTKSNKQFCIDCWNKYCSEIEAMKKRHAELDAKGILNLTEDEYAEIRRLEKELEKLK